MEEPAIDPSARLEEYRRLARDVLAPLAASKEKELAAAQAAAAEWGELVSTLASMQQAEGPLQQLHDLGAGYKVAAVIEDPSRVCIHIGAGVYPEMSLEEARLFATKKAEASGRLAAACRQELVKLQSDLIVAKSAIATFQQAPLQR